MPTPAAARTETQLVGAQTEVQGEVVRHLVAIALGHDRRADDSVRAAVLRAPSTDYEYA